MVKKETAGAAETGKEYEQRAAESNKQISTDQHSLNSCFFRWNLYDHLFIEPARSYTYYKL